MNIKETITQTILERMEQWEIPWRMTWNTIQQSMKGKPYRWVNQLILQVVRLKKEFKSSQWITFKQCVDMGGHVYKGEKSTPIVYRDVMEKENEDKPRETKKIPFLKYHSLFNLDQTSITVDPPISQVDGEKLEKARLIVANFQWPQIGTWPQPLYRPKTDVVEVPNESDFTSPEEFFVTLFHELGHSTGHASRLDRKEGMEHIIFGSDPYAKEELIAEMCAAFLAARAWIEQPILENSAAYIQGWSKRFRDNPNFLMSASNQGWDAAGYILKGREDLMELLT